MTAANPRKYWAFPRHHPLPVCPEDISKTAFIFVIYLITVEQVEGWRSGGFYLLSSFVRQHGELRRQTLQRLTQSPPGALRWWKRGWKRGTIWAQNTAGKKTKIWQMDAVHFDNILIGRNCSINTISLSQNYPFTHLSSLPNIRRSVAFSLERTAIFSALSRSLLKLLWMFLIKSRLVKNWAWISAGRYSCRKIQHNSERQFRTGEQFVFLTKCTTNLGLCGNSVRHELVSCSLIGITQLSLDVLWESDRHLYYAKGSVSETEAAQVLHTEPLKVRKVFSSSSSEKIGWRATKLMNLPSARLLPSMNSRSETEVRTAKRRQQNIDFSRQMTSSYKLLVIKMKPLW